MKQFLVFFCLLVFAVGGFWSCSTDFEVYAPDKEIRTLWGVLNPQDSVQYVRIAQAYQVRGDAIEYAANNDLSLQNLTVTLKGSNGTSYTATPVTDVPKESGTFFQGQTVYAFYTDGSGPGRELLEAGEIYTIEVGASDSPDYMVAGTTIPPAPELGGALTLTDNFGLKCLPRLFLDRDLNVRWRSRLSNEDRSKRIHGFELRVGLEITRNGVPDTLEWGPTDLLFNNFGCNEGGGNICYKFRQRELLGFWGARMPLDQGIEYRYNTRDSCLPVAEVEDLPKSLWFEVTALDTFLTKYMEVNDPKFSDLTGAKPEYTNVSGNIETYGVFGSVNVDRKYAIMRECGEYLLGLNGRPQPVACDR